MTAREWLALGAIIAVGAYLRLANLGELGFRWDEDLSGLAVRAILEKGVPELPSGMVYLRGGLFSHLMAGSAALLGFGEFALRLPAALFGIGLVGVAFLFAAALFGRVAGLVTAALVAVSYWDVELSRYARFYTAFSALYVLTLYSIWRFRVAKVSTAGGVLCVALAIVTMSLHDLAYSLALAFFFPLILKGPSAWKVPREWLWPIAASGALAAFYLAWRELVLSSRTLPALAAALPAGGSDTDELRRSFVAIPHLPLLSAAFDGLPWLVPLLLATGVTAALVLTRRFASRAAERAVLVGVAAFAAFQLFNFALLLLLALAFFKRTGVRAFASREVLTGTAIVAAAFALWLTAVLATEMPVAALEPLTLRTAARELLNYPYFYVFWGFPNEWPLASVAASIGALVAFDRVSRAPGSPAAGFALLALATPVVCNGLFASPLELFRYNAAFDALFFVFVAVAFLHWRELLPALPRRLPRLRTAGATVALVLVALAYDLNPVRGALAVERQYHNDGTLYRAFGVTRYDDFKTTAAYVARHASARDLIVTPDSREYYNYLGRVDVWLRSSRFADQSFTSDGAIRDLYVGTPLVATLAELESVLATPDTTKWVITSGSALRDPRGPLAAEIRAFLRESERHVVYIGRDGNRQVYRFE